MAGSRTLKLSILADVDNLKKNLDTGSKEVEGFGGKLEKFGKVAGAAFAAAAAAAAAYAGKLAIEGVKAAIEDEAAQKRLALALQNVTAATDAQISAVEEQILKTSLATGVADDKLRPALQRLAVATGSVERSQELLKVALDVSAATGKDVETVANALGKAYEGNTSSLARLGIGLSTAEIKTLGLEGTVKQLAATFGGAAATQANTFEGQIERLKVAFDETKESVGAALLPTLQNLLNFFINTVIPKFIQFKDAALKPVQDAIERNRESLTLLGNIIKDFVIPIILNGFGDSLRFLGKIAGGILDIIGAVVDGIKSAVSFAIDSINSLIRAYNAIPILPNVSTISKPSFTTSRPSTSLPSLPATPKIATPSTSSSPNSVAATTGAIGGASGTQKTISGVISGTANAIDTFLSAVGPKGITTSPADVRQFEERGNVVVNVNAPSVIDEEGFTRAVILALNNSTNRGTTGAGDLRTNAQIL
jgi:hypothetical protein